MNTEYPGDILWCRIGVLVRTYLKKQFGGQAEGVRVQFPTGDTLFVRFPEEGPADAKEDPVSLGPLLPDPDARCWFRRRGLGPCGPIFGASPAVLDRGPERGIQIPGPST